MKKLFINEISCQRLFRFVTTLRRILSLVLATLILLFSVAQKSWAQSSLPDKPTKLRFACWLPEQHMMTTILKEWQSEVTNRTNGLITFENFFGSALAAPLAHHDLIKKGSAQIGCIYEWYTPTKFPFGNFEYVFPFGPSDYKLLAKAYRQIRSEFPQFEEDEKKENIKLIMSAPGGEYGFMSKKPLNSIDDFKGEKVSLVGRYFGRWMPPGAVAVVRPVAERYDMLRNGVVNIDLLPFEHFWAYKIHEVTKYYVRSDFLVGFYAPIVINLDIYKSMSPELQKIMVDAGRDVELRAASSIIPAWWTDLSDKYKKAGITFSDLPKSDIEKWAKSLEDVPAEWAAEMDAKGYPGTKLIERWQSLTTELGYTWPRKWGKR